jgi:hypothetical protein
MFQTKSVEKMKTDVLCSVALFVCLFFFFEIRVFYEIMWKNIVQTGRSHDHTAHALCMLDT